MTEFGYKVTLVPHGYISHVLPDILPIMAKSEMWSRGRSKIDDILTFLFTGRMQLWLAYEAETRRAIGYNITQVREYPQCKMLVVQYTAGESNMMQYVEEVMHDTLVRYAKDAGCKGIEAFGRPGWEPHLKKFGYTVKTVMYERHFDDEETP